MKFGKQGTFQIQVAFVGLQGAKGFTTNTIIINSIKKGSLDLDLDLDYATSQLHVVTLLL
jgi:hypothetical protein